MPADGNKNRIIAVSGPTAVGKSAAALELADLLETEIISADSMQLYRGMDIGTAKLPLSERKGIPHHMIDVLDPREPSSVSIYQTMARKCADEIIRKGRIPLLCGGTGFYIDAMLYDTEFLEEDNEEIRRQLQEFVKEKGAEALHREVTAIDPEYAELHPAHDIQRNLRAMEFWLLHGKRLSQHNREEEERKLRLSDHYRYFVLFDDTKALTRRIEERTDEMIESGLEQEVASLLEAGVPENAQSMQGIGYRQFVEYFRGECTFDEAVQRIKAASRRYAKRQLTWFRREKNAIWIDIRKGDICHAIRQYLW